MDREDGEVREREGENDEGDDEWGVEMGREKGRWEI